MPVATMLAKRLFGVASVVESTVNGMLLSLDANGAADNQDDEVAVLTDCRTRGPGDRHT